jgi:outer membrane protein assembly factor BamD
MKIDLTNDHLAGKEMYIGRYYLKKKAFLAAINRFRIVTVDYQTTSHVPEALHRTVEAYLSMGLIDEAYKTASVLGHNFPNSDWYNDSYNLIKGNTE